MRGVGYKATLCYLSKMLSLIILLQALTHCSCDATNDYELENPCIKYSASKRSVTVFPDPRNIHGYLSCDSEGRAVSVLCPVGFQFSAEQNACVPRLSRSEAGESSQKRRCQESCVHGRCIFPEDLQQAIKCICDAGYEGNRCERRVDMCMKEGFQQCGLKGICRNEYGTYVCLCKNGKIGANCDSGAIDNPCTQDALSHNLTRFPLPSTLERRYVKCMAPYTFTVHQCPNNQRFDSSSSRCVELGSCSIAGCTNDGQCIEIPREDDEDSSQMVHGSSEYVPQFRCRCKPGFTGPLCETKLDFCSSMPCQNGGRCESGLFGPVCVCTNRMIDQDCASGIENPCDESSNDEVFEVISRSPKHENSFIYCHSNGHASLIQCPHNTTFNKRSVACDTDTTRRLRKELEITRYNAEDGDTTDHQNNVQILARGPSAAEFPGSISSYGMFTESHVGEQVYNSGHDDLQQLPTAGQTIGTTMQHNDMGHHADMNLQTKPQHGTRFIDPLHLFDKAQQNQHNSYTQVTQDSDPTQRSGLSTTPMRSGSKYVQATVTQPIDAQMTHRQITPQQYEIITMERPMNTNQHGLVHAGASPITYPQQPRHPSNLSPPQSMARQRTMTGPERNGMQPQQTSYPIGATIVHRRQQQTPQVLLQQQKQQQQQSQMVPIAYGSMRDRSRRSLAEWASDPRTAIDRYQKSLNEYPFYDHQAETSTELNRREDDPLEQFNLQSEQMFKPGNKFRVYQTPSFSNMPKKSSRWDIPSGQLTNKDENIWEQNDWTFDDPNKNVEHIDFTKDDDDTMENGDFKKIQKQNYDTGHWNEVPMQSQGFDRTPVLSSQPVDPLYSSHPDLAHVNLNMPSSMSQFDHPPSYSQHMMRENPSMISATPTFGQQDQWSSMYPGQQPLIQHLNTQHPQAFQMPPISAPGHNLHQLHQGSFSPSMFRNQDHMDPGQGFGTGNWNPNTGMPYQQLASNPMHESNMMNTLAGNAMPGHSLNQPLISSMTNMPQSGAMDLSYRNPFSQLLDLFRKKREAMKKTDAGQTNSTDTTNATEKPSGE